MMGIMAKQRFLIVGAGPIGTALAGRLARTGDEVLLASRSGVGPDLPGVRRLALDASDSTAVTRSADGVDALFNCVNPGAYQTWERLWPPLASSVLRAASASGAVLVTLSNLYGYGPVSAPITGQTPLGPGDHKGDLRARLWREALDAHQAGRVRVTEARASDYIGPTATAAGGLLTRYAAATLAGKTATVLADPDQPHTWTAVDDIAATLAVLATDERAWGRAWIVPSNPPVSVRQVLQELGRRAGTGAPRLRLAPRWLLRAGATVVPLLREVTGVLYQFDRPFVADGSATTDEFGVVPTDWARLLDVTAEAWAGRVRGSGVNGVNGDV